VFIKLVEFDVLKAGHFSYVGRMFLIGEYYASFPFVLVS
jgi:hypothetical protein